MPWESDLAFSEKMCSIADRYYEQIFGEFGTGVKTERFPPESPKHILDVEFSIDMMLTLTPTPFEGIGMKMEEIPFTFQEKFRGKEYLHYQDITIEYYQDWRDKTKGDFFKLAVDYYSYGYADRPVNRYRFAKDFVEFYIIKYRELKELLMNGEIKYSFKPSSSRANMMTIPLSEIPESLFLFKKTKG